MFFLFPPKKIPSLLKVFYHSSFQGPREKRYTPQIQKERIDYLTMKRRINTLLVYLSVYLIIKIGVAGGFAQACHGKKSPLQKMKVGDWLAYYSPTYLPPPEYSNCNFTFFQN